MIVKLKLRNNDIKKGLYLIPTPIGNLEDITFRAIEILKNSDYVLCEDTRVSVNLLKKYEIKAKLIPNHKFNEKKNIPKIIELLKNNLVVSLISDAGTPCISDPGLILINECLKNGIDIIPIPGPSAVTTAISISGFSEKFFFYGFFPQKKGEISKDMEILSKLNSAIIFFISAKKLNKIIPTLKENFSGRNILICREMTKLYEEFIRFEIDKLETFEKDLKGELTLVISEKLNKKDLQDLSESDKIKIKKMIDKYSIKEITKLVNKNNKISKKKIYNYYLKIKNEN